MQNDLSEGPAALFALRNLLAIGTFGSKGADAAALFIAETSLLPLRNLEVWERAVRNELWFAEQSPGRASWKSWGGPHPLLFWLDLCSHDGRKREGALRGISGAAPNAFLLALALRRFNDWVPQVRSAARETLPQVASNSDPQHVVDALWCSLDHWSSWGRLEPADQDAVMDLASTDAVAAALRSKILRATAGSAARVLAQCARSPKFDPWIVDYAREAAQPAVRARAFRWLLSGRVVWTVGRTWKWTDLAWCKGRFEPVLEERAIVAHEPFLATLGAAVADKAAFVRRVAAEFLIHDIRALGDSAHSFALQLSADANPSVAERGRFALSMLGTSI